MSEQVKKAYTGVIPKKERIAYWAGGFGQGMIYSIMSTYISDFYMNVLGLGSMFVFWLMLLARILDAFTDPMMGMIMDRANPKRGKMRSYLFLFPLPIAIITVFLFWNPQLSANMMPVYATVTYVLWGLLYTAADIPYWSAPNAMSPNAKERGMVVSISRITNGFGSAMPMVLVTILGYVIKAETSQQADEQKFLYTVLVCSIMGFLFFSQTPFSIKERVPLPKTEKKAGEPNKLLLVLKNKPLMLTAAMGILSGGRYLFQAAAAHVARYVFYIGPSLEGLSQTEKVSAMQSSFSTVQLLMQLAAGAGMFISMALAPMLYKKLNYKQLLIFSCLLGGISCVGMYFIGYDNFYAVLPFMLIGALPLGIINVVAFAMAGDCLDYMELETGHRENGLGLACQSFTQKVANALATSAIVLTYRFIHLDVSQINETGANLLSLPPSSAASVRSGMFTLISIVPAISLLICIIPILFYDLTGKKKERIVAELAERRAAAAEL